MNRLLAEAFTDELEKISRREGNGKKFAKMESLPVTGAERGVINRKLRSIRKSTGAVSLKKTEKGYCVHTHRARCSWYPSPEKIPISKVRFIASTG
jgi:hypothetical protein